MMPYNVVIYMYLHITKEKVIVSHLTKKMGLRGVMGCSFGKSVTSWKTQDEKRVKYLLMGMGEKYEWINKAQ